MMFEEQYIDMKFEEQYIEMLESLLDEGVRVPSRTGIDTLANFDYRLVVECGEFPFSTVRPCPLSMAFKEFWFFLNGKTQTKELEEQGIKFWKGNTTREFLDNRGLYYLPEGDMGKAYGSQLRAYGATTTEEKRLVKDQLRETYETLRDDRYSRRVYNTMWNPNESHLMALTPCWHSHQFVVLPDGKGKDVLHLKLINRSLDSVFGAIFAVQQYRLYQMCMAKLLGYEVGVLSCDLTHVHVYFNQIEYAEEILDREFYFEKDSYDIDRIKIKKELNTLEDLLSMEWGDFEIKYPTVNNEEFETPRPPMAV